MIKSVGIDVGSSQIKIVEIHAGSKDFQIYQTFDIPLDLNPSKDNQLVIIEHLRKIMATYDSIQTRFVLGFRQEQVATRLLQFPFHDRIKIYKALPFELEEHLPFASDRSLFEAKIVGQNHEVSRVLACAVLRDRMESLLSFAKDCQVDPAVVSTEGFAVANLFENWTLSPTQQGSLESQDLTGTFALGEAPKNRIQMCVDIGHSHCIVSAMIQNQLVATRSISWGGKSVAEAIARKYDLPFVEAVKELNTKGFLLLSHENASRDQMAFSDTILLSLRDLIRDLRLTKMEIESEVPGEVTQILLTGGVAQLKNLGAVLTQSLEVPVNRLSHSIHPAGISFEALGGNLHKFAIAIGLAMEGLKKSKNPPLNFRKGEFSKKDPAVTHVVHFFRESISYIVLLFVLFFSYSYLRANRAESLVNLAEETLRNAAKSIPALGKRSGPENVRRYLRYEFKKQAQINELSAYSSLNSGIDILKQVSESLVRRDGQLFVLQSFDLSDDTLTLQGYSNSASTLSNAKSALSNLAQGKQVQELSPVGTKATKGTSFALRFRVDRGTDHSTDRGETTAGKEAKAQ